MRDEVTVLAGTGSPHTRPWPPFDPRAVDFLADLSAAILRDPGMRRWEGASAFAFWCRRAHLEALERRHHREEPRLGRGLAFHVAPSNVPVMFGYTFAIGLLAGNANLVRLSSRRREEDAALLAVLEKVLAREEHREVRERTGFVSYERNDEITARFCARCDVRVVWGGDATVASLRALPIPPHGVELDFPDRWSLAVFSQEAFSNLSGEERAALAHRFYNDTYQMDQNACSSPQLVLWLEDGGGKDCRGLWWQAVAEEAEKRYDFGFWQAARKREKLCLYAMTMEEPPMAAVERYAGDRLCVAELDRLPADPTILRGGFGLFFQCGLANLEELPALLGPKVQTLVCGGLEPRRVAELLARQGCTGVDRVVPLGQALEMDTLWDGKDLIAALSRMIVG